MKLENVRGIIIVSGTAHYKFYKKNPEKLGYCCKGFWEILYWTILKYHPYQYNTYFSPVTIEMIGVLLDLEGFWNGRL